MMVKAHVSPGLSSKTKPQLEQLSNWDQPENSRPWPQCGQRLRIPAPKRRRDQFPVSTFLRWRSCGGRVIQVIAHARNLQRQGIDHRCNFRSLRWFVAQFDGLVFALRSAEAKSMQHAIEITLDHINPDIAPEL